MFVPKYTISNSILKNVSLVEGAKELILDSDLIPAWETKLKNAAIFQSIYYGAALEGNKLSEEEVQNILDGIAVTGRDIDITEIKNLQDSLTFLSNTAQNLSESYLLSLELLFELHRILMQGILPAVGSFRTRQIILRESKTGNVTYSPPPAAEVPYLMEDLFNFLNSDLGRTLHPIIRAGIVHFEIYRIHPFLEGNSAIARLFSQLLLILDHYSLNDYLSNEPSFYETETNYHQILQATARQKVLDTHERDLTLWLEYYCACFARESLKLKDQVKKISAASHLKDTLGEEVGLTERQILIMEFLHRHSEMRNKDFRKIFPNHSDDTVLREIKFLKQKGLVKKVGNTKSAAYVATS